MTATAHLELLDWRRRISELFAELRRRPPDATTLEWFRAEKDALFREHPQSPVPPAERASFIGLSYWPFGPDARVLAQFEPLAAAPATDASTHTSSGGGDIAFTRIGHLDFTLQGHALRLPAFWIDGYAGGLFVPFRDQTSGHATYGGGRYLLDTIKSADLGSDAATNTVVLDFNYAYHPSCTYDPVWVCPLAPPDSRLPIGIEAGEKLP
jgi:uncharacterized protein (DUF1684 family)